MKALLKRMGIVDRQTFLLFAFQFLKFGIVGVANTAISLGIYYALVSVGVHYIIANIVGFIASVLNAFFWNNKLVFPQKENGKDSGRLAKTFIAYGSTFLLSNGLLILMVDIMHISKWVAPLIGLCVTIPLNFLLNKFWTFR